VAASKRLGSFTESVIREMTRLSEQSGAINLSQGMPDFPPHPKLIQAATSALKKGPNQYSVTWGDKGLRDAIAEKAKWFNGIDADPERNVTITCGSTEAVTSAIFGLTTPGDRIVITDPYYENYLPDALLAGCDLLHVPFSGERLEFDAEALKDALSTHPKLLILNTPNNPTGRVLEKTQLKLIADLCEENSVWAITDEIYEHITYDNKHHISLASIGNMHERTVTVSAASKTYSVTGWRVGWAIAADELTNALRKVHDYFTICAPAPLQHALITAINFPTSYYSRLAKAYNQKRRIMMQIFDNIGIEYNRPEGAYYILANSPEMFESGKEFAGSLLKYLGIAVLPAVALYQNKELGRRKIRVAFCKKDSTLHQVGRRLKKLSELQRILNPIRSN